MSDDEPQADSTSSEPDDDPIVESPDPIPTGTEAATGTATEETLDLDAMEAELAGVEAALDRLEAGTYWTDEVTGGPIPDDVLAADPVARRAP